MSRRATIEALKLRKSAVYAPANPTVAMSSPPIAGPTIEAAWKFSWLRAMAAGSRSAGTSRGIDDERAGWSTEASPAATKATTKTRISGAVGTIASTTRARLADGQAGLGDEEQPSPVHRVGDRAGPRARRRGSG